MWAAASRPTHSAAVAKQTRCPAWQARMPSPIDRCVLPVPGVIRGLILGWSRVRRSER